MSNSPKCPHCKARFYSIYGAAMHREWTQDKQCLSAEQMQQAGMILYHGAWLAGKSIVAEVLEILGMPDSITEEK